MGEILVAIATSTAATAAATAVAATATTTTAAAAAVAATATAATTTRTLFARAGDIDRQGTAVELGAVEGLNGLLGFFGGAHGDEAEAAGFAAHPVHHQVGLNDGAVGGERVLEVVLSGVEGKVSYKQFVTHVIYYCPTDSALTRLFPTIGFQIITEQTFT
jgi:hypothetical protein